MPSVGDHETQGFAGQEISLVVASCRETALQPACSQVTPPKGSRHRQQGVLKTRQVEEQLKGNRYQRSPQVKNPRMQGYFPKRAGWKVVQPKYKVGWKYKVPRCFLCRFCGDPAHFSFFNKKLAEKNVSTAKFGMRGVRYKQDIAASLANNTTTLPLHDTQLKKHHNITRDAH